MQGLSYCYCYCYCYCHHHYDDYYYHYHHHYYFESALPARQQESTPSQEILAPRQKARLPRQRMNTSPRQRIIRSSSSSSAHQHRQHISASVSSVLLEGKPRFEDPHVLPKHAGKFELAKCQNGDSRALPRSPTHTHCFG